MKKLFKTLIYSLTVFIGIFGMGQLNVLADDAQTDESSSESVKSTDSTPQQWGDATWYVKDNVLYLGGTEIPDYYTGKLLDMHSTLP
jgi:surface antigen